MVGSLVGSTRGIPFNRSDMIGKGYARFAANQGSIALQRDEGSLATAERLPLQIVGSAGDVKDRVDIPCPLDWSCFMSCRRKAPARRHANPPLEGWPG